MSSHSAKMKVSELAEIAGVSPATVSKVINGRPGISDSTRKRVEKVLQDHDYCRPLVSTKTSPTIELVLEYMQYNGTIELMRRASYWAQQAGLALTVTQTSQADASEEYFRNIIDRNPLGVIMQQLGGLNPLSKSLLRARNIPVVIVDPVNTVDPDVMSVSIDNWTSGYQAAQHLISLGHSRIAIIRGPKHLQTALARFAGFQSALDQAHLTLPDNMIADGDYLPDLGYKAACKLLDQSSRPTAIFCCNDLTAVSVYRAAHERKIKIPKHLSVVGFDDIYPAPYLNPPLTTIHQPFNELAHTAVSMIVNAKNSDIINPHVILPTSVTVRESTMPPIME